MIQRFLSMNSDWIPLVSYINPLISTLKNGEYYRLIITMIPKQTNSFYKYIKKSSKDDIPQWLIDIFITHYKISNREAIEDIKLLKIKEFEYIVCIAHSYGINDKQRKELQKWRK